MIYDGVVVAQTLSIEGAKTKSVSIISIEDHKWPGMKQEFNVQELIPLGTKMIIEVKNA